jgi:hypothetical protein
MKVNLKAMRGRIALPKQCVRNRPQMSIVFRDSFRSPHASPRRFWYRFDPLQCASDFDFLSHSCLPLRSRAEGGALMPVWLGPRPGHAKACPCEQTAQREVSIHQDAREERSK